nr:nonsense-mediated mRNA decay protein [Colletotrichum truncatum]KAF6784801.1 nonsense-mediated mRNA decay protein [Colletotrichum truncatum]
MSTTIVPTIVVIPGFDSPSSALLTTATLFVSGAGTATTSTNPPATSTLVPPTVCNERCENAYGTAQQYGKDPVICQPGSDFQTDLASCTVCIEENAEAAQEVLRTSIWTKLEQYTEFCKGDVKLFTSTFVIPNNDGVSITVFRTYTTTVPFTFLTSSATNSSTSSASVSTTSAAVEASQTAQREQAQPRSSAWIAGPIVGAIVVIGILLGGCWFWRRRRKQKAILPTTAIADSDGKGRYEKAELHANHMQRSPPMELEGSYPDPVPEMSANEVAAQEMLASDKNKPTVAELSHRHT